MFLLPKTRRLFNTPWYHDFSVLGKPTPQREATQSHGFAANQKAKEAVLFPYIKSAVTQCKAKGLCKGVELFCADGFYSHYALRCGADHMTGYDIGLSATGGLPVHLEQARLMARLLGHSSRCTFEERDVRTISGTYDLVICAGGLYHLHDPQNLLKLLRDKTKTALIVQSSITLETEDPGYFEVAPAGRPLGSRFSFGWLRNAITDAGFQVTESDRNELTGNPDPKDRGSAYFLCQ